MEVFFSINPRCLGIFERRRGYGCTRLEHPTRICDMRNLITVRVICTANNQYTYAETMILHTHYTVVISIVIRVNVAERYLCVILMRKSRIPLHVRIIDFITEK